MLLLQATPKAPMAVVDDSPQMQRTSTGGGSIQRAIQVTPYDVYRCYYTYIRVVIMFFLIYRFCILSERTNYIKWIREIFKIERSFRRRF